MKERGNQKSLSGVVVSDGMDKTVVIEVTRKIQHPVYKKYINRTRKISAHDEKNECSKGDIVRISGTRPLSKTKRFRVVEVIRKIEE